CRARTLAPEDSPSIPSVEKPVTKIWTTVGLTCWARASNELLNRDRPRPSSLAGDDWAKVARPESKMPKSQMSNSGTQNFRRTRPLSNVGPSLQIVNDLAI